RALQVVGETIALGIDIGCNVVSDLSRIAAQAHISIESGGTEPHRTAFVSDLQNLPKSDVVASISALAIRLFEREILAPAIVKETADRGVAIGPIQDDTAD